MENQVSYLVMTDEGEGTDCWNAGGIQFVLEEALMDARRWAKENPNQRYWVSKTEQVIEYITTRIEIL